MRCQLLDSKKIKNHCNDVGCHIEPIAYSHLTGIDPSYGKVDARALSEAGKFTKETLLLEAALKHMNRESDGKEQRSMFGGLIFRSLDQLTLAHISDFNQQIISAERNNPTTEEYLSVLENVGYEAASLIFRRTDINHNENLANFLGSWILTQGIDDIIDDCEEDLARRARGMYSFNPVVIGEGSSAYIDESLLEEAKGLQVSGMQKMESFFPEDIGGLKSMLNNYKEEMRESRMQTICVSY